MFLVGKLIPFSYRPVLVLLTVVSNIQFGVNLFTIFGDHGWRTLLPPVWPGLQIPVSTPYVGWVCCWFSPLLREVFLRVLRFSLSSKTNISKFQFDQESGRRRTTYWMCYLQIVIYFIHSFVRSFVRLFVRLLDLSLSTCSPYCPFFLFHHQAQKKERSINVQKRIQASFSKLTM